MDSHPPNLCQLIQVQTPLRLPWQFLQILNFGEILSLAIYLRYPDLNHLRHLISFLGSLILLFGLHRLRHILQYRHPQSQYHQQCVSYNNHLKSKYRYFLLSQNLNKTMKSRIYHCHRLCDNQKKIVLNLAL